MQTYKIFFLEHRSQYLNSLGDSLAQLGHKIFYQSSLLPDEVEAGIAYFKPDIFITVGWCPIPLRSRYPDRIHELCKKYRLFHIYWATEDKIHHTTWSVPFLQRFRPDLVWTIHPDCIEKYEKLGTPASYLNFSFNPRMFPTKKKEDKEIFDISLIGTTHLHVKTYRYESLRHLLFPLIQDGKKTHIWGYGWHESQATIKKHFGRQVPGDWIRGYLPYKETASVYRSSKIVLGVQNALDQVSQRTFEILGTGSFMITSKTQAIMEMFEDRREVVVSSSPEKTIELVNFYLNRPELRFEIGENARRKIMEQYTFQHQLEKIWPMVDILLKQKQSMGTLRLSPVAQEK